MSNKINKYLRLIAKKDRIYCLIILVLTLFTVLFETLSIGLIIPFTQILLAESNNLGDIYLLKFFDLASLNKEKLVTLSIVLFAIIYTTKALLLTLFSYIEQDFLTKVKVNISKKLFSIYINKNYLFHVDSNSSKLAANLIELKRFAAVIRDSSYFLTEILVLISIIILLLYFEPLGAIASLLLFSSFALLFYFKIQKDARKWGHQRQIFQSHTIKNINDCFKSIKEIKVFNREHFFTNQFVKFSKLEIETEFKKHSFVNSLPRFWFEWITIIGLLILISILYITYQDTDKIFPIIALFGAAAFRIVPSIIRIMNITQKIRYNYPIIENLLKELDSLKNIDQNINEKYSDNLSFEFNRFKANNLSFHYPGTDKEIIKNLSFEIKKNTFYGITGKSGSGKTTLINILLGLIKPNKGQLFIDDKELVNGFSFTKNMVGYVPQHIYLLDDSIKKNIAFGIEDEKIDNSKILKVVEDIQLQKLINETKKGLDANVGEFGDKLSGGQIQRLGIARALYLSPKILIMDESTSALDDETEEKIIKELHKFKKDMTIIFITHTSKILNNCDNILDLNKI